MPRGAYTQIDYVDDDDDAEAQERVCSPARAALACIWGYLIVGCAVGHFTFHTSMIDSFYFTAFTMSTAGYRVDAKLTDQQKMALVVIMLTITGVLFSAIGVLTEHLLEQQEHLDMSRIRRMIWRRKNADDKSAQKKARKRYTEPWYSEITFAVMVVTAYIMVGAEIMHTFHGWTMVDSVYFWVLTITTVGSVTQYDKQPTIPQVKLFAAIWMLLGMLVLGLFIRSIARSFMELSRRGRQDALAATLEGSLEQSLADGAMDATAGVDSKSQAAASADVDVLSDDLVGRARQRAAADESPSTDALVLALLVESGALSEDKLAHYKEYCSSVQEGTGQG